MIAVLSSSAKFASSMISHSNKPIFKTTYFTKGCSSYSFLLMSIGIPRFCLYGKSTSKGVFADLFYKLYNLKKEYHFYCPKKRTLRKKSKNEILYAYYINPFSFWRRLQKLQFSASAICQMSRIMPRSLFCFLRKSYLWLLHKPG